MKNDETIEVDHGGDVTNESYLYDCDFCDHTCDGENISYREDGGKKACPCCIELLNTE